MIPIPRRLQFKHLVGVAIFGVVRRSRAFFAEAVPAHVYMFDVRVSRGCRLRRNAWPRAPQGTSYYTFDPLLRDQVH